MNIYQRAVDRNIHETIQALRENRVLSEIEDYQNKYSIYGLNFFSICYFALFNSMMSHAAKVLDEHKDSASFWFVYSKQKSVVESLKSFDKEKINHLRRLTTSIKHVRDRTLFHIDKRAIFDPKQIWKEADIKGNQLKLGLDYLYDLLYELCDDGFKKSKFTLQYNADDVHQLLDYARRNELCIFVEE